MTITSHPIYIASLMKWSQLKKRIKAHLVDSMRGRFDFGVIAYGTICQVRGKRNRCATQKEMEIIRRWAQKEKLSILDYL